MDHTGISRKLKIIIQNSLKKHWLKLVLKTRMGWRKKIIWVLREGKKLKDTLNTQKRTKTDYSSQK